MKFNDDEVKGKVDQTVGRAKEYIGRSSGDPVTEQEGADQRAQGDLQAGFGKARRKVGEALSDAGKKLGR